jgi:hypothetical protein
MEKILVLVKTYPNISKKYRETVCTAGVKENGDWVRMYPIPFRFLNDGQKFTKYQWINAQLEKNKQDTRPESYKVNATTLEPLERISTKNERGFAKNMFLRQKSLPI